MPYKTGIHFSLSVAADYTRFLSFLREHKGLEDRDMKVLRWIVKRFHNHKMPAESQSKRELHACSAQEGKSSHDAVFNNEEYGSWACLGKELEKMCGEDAEFGILQNAAEYERILFYDALRLKLITGLYHAHQQQFAQPAVKERCEQ